jgi:hypothetical protein
MPITPRDPDQEEPIPGFVKQDDRWVGINEEMLDDTAWQDANAEKSAQGAGAPLTIIGRMPGRATVRTNQTMILGISNIMIGSVSGRIPAGAVFEGRDNNGNGIPDVLEDAIRRGLVKFPITTN